MKIYIFYVILSFLIATSVSARKTGCEGNCENGFGTLETKTTTYKGDFKEGRMHGKGEYVWKDRGSYKGDFREGFFEGIGVHWVHSGL